MKNYLPYLFVAALVSTGESTIKIYPILFSIFIFTYSISRFKFKKSISYPATAFIVTASFFTLLNIENSFESTSFLKLIINISFLAAAGSYIKSVDSKVSIKLLKISSGIFLILSFGQILSIVHSKSLWLLPFQLENSTSSYAIQSSNIFFGDQNKNIWASKVSIFFIVFLYCQYMEKARHRALSAMIYAFALFSLIYISSRTAQIASMSAFLIILFYELWFVRKKKLALIGIGALAAPAIIYLLHAIIRIDYNTLLRFDPALGAHMGDGLLSRLIIWNHVLSIAQTSDYLTGNGILSFNYYTDGIFPENNPHNVFLNILLDFGLATFATYLAIIYITHRGTALSRLLILPFLVFSNSQYLGYDSDLIILFILPMAVTRFFKFREISSRKESLNQNPPYVIARGV